MNHVHRGSHKHPTEGKISEQPQPIGQKGPPSPSPSPSPYLPPTLKLRLRRGIIDGISYQQIVKYPSRFLRLISPSMASVSGICSSSSSFKPKHFTARSSPSSALTPSFRVDSLTFPVRPKLADRILTFTPSVAREVSADLSKNDLFPQKKGLEKDPGALWGRYVDWLYQHKELGLFLDVSRIGFTDEFVEEMEPKFQAAFRAMQELEKGAIANPDEGRMVGHYWLRNYNLAPNQFLRSQINNALDAVCKFAEDVVSGKVSFYSISSSIFFC